MGKQHIPHKQRVELLDSYDKSKVSIKEYAAANGIGYSTLQRWLHGRKAALNTTEDARPLNAVTIKTSGQRPIDKRQPHDTSNSSVHFMDITSHIIPAVPPEDDEEGAYVQENSDSVSNTHASAHTVVQKLVSTKSSASHNQLDVCLPNGIRMTLHHTSLDMSVALIKSLV